MISLVPKNTLFFDLLEDLAHAARDMAQLVPGALDANPNLAKLAQDATHLRNKSDEAFDKFVEALHDAFVTPIDRDDLYAVGFDLEKAIETSERLIARWSLYNLPPAPGPQADLVQILGPCSRQVDAALPMLRRRSAMGGITQPFRELRRLYREAEGLHRKGLQSLREEAGDPFRMMTTKECLDLAMAAVVSYRSLADNLHKAVIRNV